MQRVTTVLNHAGFRRYAANISWLMGEKILRMSVGLFVGIWVARYLGPKQFGLLNYAQSLVFLFTTIATLGLDGIVVRELVKDESRRDKLMGSAFGLKLFGAIIILPLLALAVQLTSNDAYTNLLVFIIASSAIFQSFNIIDFYFQSKVLSRYVAWANAIALVISSTIKIALILNEAPLTAFAILVTFDGLVLAVGLAYFYAKSHRQRLLAWRFEWQTAKGLLKDSWPLILSSFAVSIYMKIDQVMIKEMLNAEAVGQYAAAVRLSEAWYFVPMAVASSLFPAIVNAKKQNEHLYHSRLQRLYTLMVGMAIAIAIPTTFLSDWLVNLLYGAQYIQASGVLIIHIWAGVFVFLAVASGKYLTVENMVMKVFYRNISGVIVNIVLNIALIPIVGINGAAIAVLASWMVSGYLYDFFDQDTRMMFKMKSRAIVAYDLFFNINNYKH